MGTYTYSTFQSNLTFELHKRDDISAYVGNWINAAYLDLTTRDRFWDLKVPQPIVFPELCTSSASTTTDGRAYISLPTDCLYPITIHDATSDKRLHNMTWRAYIEKTDRADTTAESQLDKWVRYGGYIYLYPTPDASYSLTTYYYKRPALLSASGDVTAIGEEWDEPILKLAVWQGLMRLKDYEKAALEKAEWVAMLAGKLGAYKKQELDREEFLKPDYAYLQGFEYR